MLGNGDVKNNSKILVKNELLELYTKMKQFNYGAKDEVIHFGKYYI